MVIAENCMFIPRMKSRWPPHRSIWAATWQNQQSGCAPSEDSDQPGHPPSLIRVFAVRMKKAWVLSYQLSAQRKLWSDWADAQADLSLHWAHIHFVVFFHVVAQLFLLNQIWIYEENIEKALSLLIYWTTKITHHFWFVFFSACKWYFYNSTYSGVFACSLGLFMQQFNVAGKPCEFFLETKDKNVIFGHTVIFIGLFQHVSEYM